MYSSDSVVLIWLFGLKYCHCHIKCNLWFICAVCLPRLNVIVITISVVIIIVMVMPSVLWCTFSMWTCRSYGGRREKTIFLLLWLWWYCIYIVMMIATFTAKGKELQSYCWDLCYFKYGFSPRNRTQLEVSKKPWIIFSAYFFLFTSLRKCKMSVLPPRADLYSTAIKNWTKQRKERKK